MELIRICHVINDFVLILRLCHDRHDFRLDLDLDRVLNSTLRLKKQFLYFVKALLEETVNGSMCVI